jgi:hypothetical protein
MTGQSLGERGGQLSLAGAASAANVAKKPLSDVYRAI